MFPLLLHFCVPLTDTVWCITNSDGLRSSSDLVRESIESFLGWDGRRTRVRCRQTQGGHTVGLWYTGPTLLSSLGAPFFHDDVGISSDSPYRTVWAVQTSRRVLLEDASVHLPQWGGESRESPRDHELLTRVGRRIETYRTGPRPGLVWGCRVRQSRLDEPSGSLVGTIRWGRDGSRLRVTWSGADRVSGKVLPEVLRGWSAWVVNGFSGDKKYISIVLIKEGARWGAKKKRMIFLSCNRRHSFVDVHEICFWWRLSALHLNVYNFCYFLTTTCSSIYNPPISLLFLQYETGKYKRKKHTQKFI